MSSDVNPYEPPSAEAQVAEPAKADTSDYQRRRRALAEVEVEIVMTGSVIAAAGVLLLGAAVPNLANVDDRSPSGSGIGESAIARHVGGGSPAAGLMASLPTRPATHATQAEQREQHRAHAERGVIAGVASAATVVEQRGPTFVGSSRVGIGLRTRLASVGCFGARASRTAAGTVFTIRGWAMSLFQFMPPGFIALEHPGVVVVAAQRSRFADIGLTGGLGTVLVLGAIEVLHTLDASVVARLAPRSALRAVLVDDALRARASVRLEQAKRLVARAVRIVEALEAHAPGRTMAHRCSAVCVAEAREDTVLLVADLVDLALVVDETGVAVAAAELTVRSGRIGAVVVGPAFPFGELGLRGSAEGEQDRYKPVLKTSATSRA